MARYDRYGRRKRVNMGLVVPITVTTLALGSVFWLLMWAIQSSDAYEARFTKQCHAAGGQPMFTRDTDFCLKGNTILYMHN